jgi:hypothetical protein
MTLKQMPRSRIILRPQQLRPAVNEQMLFLAPVIIAVSIAPHFARMHVSELWIFLLKILKAAVAHV